MKTRRVVPIFTASDIDEARDAYIRTLHSERLERRTPGQVAFAPLAVGMEATSSVGRRSAWSRAYLRAR
jgi:hypothetical protein